MFRDKRLYRTIAAFIDLWLTWGGCVFAMIFIAMILCGAWMTYAGTQTGPETERFSITIEIRATDSLYYVHDKPQGGTEIIRRATTYSIYPAHYERAMDALKKMGYDVRPVKIRGLPPDIGDVEGEVNGVGGINEGLPNGKYFTVVSEDIFFDRLIIDAERKSYEIRYEKCQYQGQPKYSFRSRSKKVAEQLTHALLFPE